RTAFRAVLDRGVDGLISCHDDLTLLPDDIPVVLFQQRHPRCDSIVRDGETAMRRAVEYLLGLGHRKLGTVCLDRQRFEALINGVLGDHGVATPALWANSARKAHIDAARACMGQILALPPAERPTALICRNDTTAMAVISTAGEHGLVVPRDFSVIGSDDVSLGAVTNPPLTTFGVPPAELARRLVDLLFRRLQEPAAPIKEYLLQQKLIERASCAQPRGCCNRPVPGEEKYGRWV
ncbi:MAG: LacI family transcriptional regulator, partial [Lentisphaerae bacterium]|nr:LacI family transcriptional regulator [Lentisphaerota bacterium]